MPCRGVWGTAGKLWSGEIQEKSLEIPNDEISVP